jgi:hypothetical protein
MDESEQSIRRYLLGNLSETEQCALEERYFADPQVFDQVLKIESELVDAYARGQLVDEAREEFEQFYMIHPSRKARAKFAEALAARLDQSEEPASSDQSTWPVSWWQRLLASLRGQRPTLRLSVAFATLLIVLGGFWIFIATRRQQQGELAQTQPAHETQPQRIEPPERVEGSPKQAPQPTPQPPSTYAPPFVSLALTVGGVRSDHTEQTPTLVIPQGTAQVRLLLNIKGNDYSSYRASLQTAGGAEVFSQMSAKPKLTKTGTNFVFTVPASNLTTGDYVLTLRGVGQAGEVDDLSKSLFRIEKR